MSVKHTPGPWQWTREKLDGTWHAFLRSTQPIETLRHHDSLVTAMREDLAAFPYAIDTADARLIAKAPELASLLRTFAAMNKAHAVADCLCIRCEPIQTARALLKEIDGKD